MAKTMGYSCVTASLILGCAATGLMLGAASARAGEFGLAITSLYYGPYDDATDCPDGWALTPKETFLQSLAPDQRKEFVDRDKRVGSLASWVSRIASERRGPNGENACEAPQLINDPQMRTGQSKTSFGVDLDGGDRTSHCDHQEFTGLHGEPGVDNQMARLTACIRGLRKEYNNRNGTLPGDRAMLIRVTNVDDMENDNDVTVTLYKSADTFIKDGQGRAVPDMTLRGDANAPAFRATTHGKIVDGVLITDPVDALYVTAEGKSWDIRGSRMRIKLRADGYGDGMLAGYFEKDSFWETWASQYQQGLNIGYSCPALYEAMNRLADGDKDPATGKCRALSSAFNIKVVRTFIMPADKPGTPLSENTTPSVDRPATQLAANSN